MSVTIKKATIKNGHFLTYSYDLVVDDVNISHPNVSSDAPIHEDCKNAFLQLTPFFAHVCEEIRNNEMVKDAIDKPEDHLIRPEDESEDVPMPFLKYAVTGFVIGGKGDSEGVTLSGTKLLDSGDIISFSTPFIRFEGSYLFACELSNAIEVAKKEVFDYMQGKQAPKSQVFDLFEKGNTDTEDEDFE